MSFDPHRVALLLNSSHPQDVKTALSIMLSELNARAAGIWKVERETLLQQSFSAVDDMPLDVSAGFEVATKSVSLNQVGLGIVNAVLKREPVPAYVDPNKSPLRDSASWIEKFECLSSLSVPVFHEGHLSRVIAVSFSEFVTPDRKEWQQLIAIAKAIEQTETCEN